MPDGVGMKDRDIKTYFQAFIIDRHLDPSLNNFGAWKVVNGKDKDDHHVRT
jgi:hypothetical protein